MVGKGSQNGVSVNTTLDNGTEEPLLKTSSSNGGANDDASQWKPVVTKTWGIFATPNTFHYELNLYSALAIGLTWYYLIPPGYNLVMQGLMILLTLDMLNYYQKRGNMAGVPYTPPLVTLLAMTINPVRFWAEMANIASASKDGMCANNLCGRLMVLATSQKVVREIFTGEGTYQMWAHPNGRWLFGDDNLIYLSKEPHKAVRRMLTPVMFGGDALKLYAQTQDCVIRKFLQKMAQGCMDGDKPMDVRVGFRSMAAACSQECFFGPYLDDDMRQHLEEDILKFTLGFLCLPFPYLGSGLSKSVAAKDRLHATVATLVPKARKWIEQGNEPRCMIEFWAQSILTNAEQQGKKYWEVPGCDDASVTCSMTDFLFAAQDAMNSALTYAADVMESRPDVMEKVAAEVQGVLGSDAKDAWKIRSQPDLLPYTGKVANQLLHHKPPVPMALRMCIKDSYLGTSQLQSQRHFIPKGAIVVPTILYSARVAGESTDSFDPERENQDTQFFKCVTFGGGQHKCPGRRYAETLLGVFLTIASTNYQFQRVGQRPGQDDFMYFPTLFPKENMFMVTTKE